MACPKLRAHFTGGWAAPSFSPISSHPPSLHLGCFSLPCLLFPPPPVPCPRKKVSFQSESQCWRGSNLSLNARAAGNFTFLGWN